MGVAGVGVYNRYVTGRAEVSDNGYVSAFISIMMTCMDV